MNSDKSRVAEDSGRHGGGEEVNHCFFDHRKQGREYYIIEDGNNFRKGKVLLFSKKD